MLRFITSPNENGPARVRSETVGNLCPMRRTYDHAKIHAYPPDVN